MKFLNVVGTRPNFMKIAPFQRELSKRGLEHVLVHSGQHYDDAMSEQFFDDLGLSRPAYNLSVGSDTQAVQTARVMERFEPVLDEEEPDTVVVVGDVNSTLAAGLVAAKKPCRLVHIEAGVRSENREMPEEINRLVVDRIADDLFCFDDEAVDHLKTEGVDPEHIYLVGDIMIDSLLYCLDRMDDTRELDVDLPDGYGVLTLHRPTNVDDRASLEYAYEVLSSVQERLPLVFPAHPRTRNRLEEYGLLEKWNATFCITPPLNYRDFVYLMDEAQVVLTDSGSIQQETSVLGVPCLTLRDETDRAITIRKGTNELVGLDREGIMNALDRIQEDRWKKQQEIPLWDGHTAERIVDVLQHGGDGTSP